MAVLITGATGFLGNIIVVGLLTRTSQKLILPIRTKHSTESIQNNLRTALAKEGVSDPDSLLKKVRTLSLERLEDLKQHRNDLQEWEVDEFIHCAGSLDYLNIEDLKRTNVDLTQELLSLGRELSLRRFLYLSTAFSSGFRDDLIREELHPEPISDPTAYTLTKREAERLVAESGLPFLIFRPSIVIGDSRDGSYVGKPYGIYQFIDAGEKIVGTKYFPSAHFVAPKLPQNFIHQDAFMDMFNCGYETLPDGSIFNMVAHPDTLPTIREVFTQWFETCTHPKEITYYSNIEEIPVLDIELCNRMMLEISKINSKIISRPWNFETKTLDRFIDQGFTFANTTKESIRKCFEWKVKQSTTLQSYLENNRDFFPEKMKIIDYATGEVEEIPVILKDLKITDQPKVTADPSRPLIS